MIKDWTTGFYAHALLVAFVPFIAPGFLTCASAAPAQEVLVLPSSQENNPASEPESTPEVPVETRLIDKSIEPPLSLSGDWEETTPPAAAGLNQTASGPLSDAESGRTPEAGPQPAFGPVSPAARQPQGILTGRVIYMNAGHGWIWDPDYWRLQRGVTQEMNEDYGNLDQLNLFAAFCFNAGATVVSFRPLGQQNREVVMDNDDPGVTWTGPWANSTSTIFYGSPGDVPYRYAPFSSTETARATYTPNIPEAGYYPVYTWVRHGSDRGDQLYRIRHSGGESQVRVPHHMVGNGWVWLGEYYFNAGSNPTSGSVVISNLRGSSTGTYTFADAIRFGNGMGSVNRGTGVSTYPREDESSRYWVQAGLGQGQSATLYNGGGEDESDSWSTPSKMSAEMNRAEGGSANGRVHISFHSNAGGGRGVLALITGDPTPRQKELAQLCGAEVNADLVALGSPPLEVPWSNRSNVTYTGGYSEIDGSLFNYEMAATIIEVAFHDSADDAKLLRDPKARTAIARAAMHAAVKYFAQYDGLTAAYPPEPPTGARARGGADGSVMLRWDRPVSSGGSGAPAGYVIYRSADGLGFGQPVVVNGDVTGHTLTGLKPATGTYFRIAAFNTAGESFPSETAACSPPATLSQPRALIVNAFDRNDRTLNLRQNVTRQAYTLPGGSGAIERVLPRRSNAFSYAVPHGKALAAAGWAFDSCQNEAAGLSVALADYAVVIWACGQESTADETFDAAEQNRVSDYRQAGGALFVSGSEIAYDLGRANGPTAADRSFLTNQLKVTLASDDAGSHTVTAVSGAAFSGLTAAAFDDGSRGIYPARSPDVLNPAGASARAALRYSGVSAGAAAVQDDGSADGGGRTIILGFPFETLPDPAQRAAILSAALNFLNTGRDAEVSLIPRGSLWKYRDDGVIPSADWTSPAFDDSTWRSGYARLGYGGDGESTLLSFGSNPASVYPAAWFRHSFLVPDPLEFEGLRVEIQRDDGLILHLNGTELLRDNLPAGPLSGLLATTAISGTDETAWQIFTLPSTSLLPGENVLTAEVRQSSANSSDLGFDLRLSGLHHAAIPYENWRAAAFGSSASDPAIAGDLADPDHDGLANLLEYALSLSPARPDNSPLTPTLNFSGELGGIRPALTFTHSVSATGVTLTLETAENPAGPWIPAARSTAGAPFESLLPGFTLTESPNTPVHQIQIRLPTPSSTGPSRLFLRLSASR